MNRKTMFLVQSAVIAALYAALFYAQNLILPGTASFAVQVRIAEIMCVFALWTPAAIPGLSAGCILANIATVSSLPFDMIFGTAATLLASVFMYLARNVRIKKYPALSLFMPVIFNAVFVGLEIEIFLVDGGFRFADFLIQGLLVGAGEVIAVMIMGGILAFVIEKKGLQKKLFGI